MSDLISRNALLDAMPKNDELLSVDVRRIICEAPDVDAEPVRHASWVLGVVEPGYFTPGGNRPWVCSNCKEVKSWGLARPNDKYCQNCGAYMCGGNNNE